MCIYEPKDVAHTFNDMKSEEDIILNALVLHDYI